MGVARCARVIRTCFDESRAVQSDETVFVRAKAECRHGARARRGVAIGRAAEKRRIGRDGCRLRRDVRMLGCT